MMVLHYSKLYFIGDGGGDDDDQVQCASKTFLHKLREVVKKKQIIIEVCLKK